MERQFHQDNLQLTDCAFDVIHAFLEVAASSLSKSSMDAELTATQATEYIIRTAIFSLQEKDWS